MKTINEFQPIALVDTEMETLNGGNFSLKWNHTHDTGESFVDENGDSWSVSQRCNWWGFHETSDFSRD